MKKILLKICLTMILISCKEEVKPKDYLVFSGKIENTTDGELSLFIDDKAPIKLKEDGSFSDTIQHVDSRHYTFRDAVKNKMNIYLENGKDVHITYDAENFEKTIAFSGEGAAVNNYILKKGEIKKQLVGAIDSIFTFSQLEEPVFKENVLKLKNATLKELSTTENISETYRELEKRNIDYEYLLSIGGYEGFQRFLLGKMDFKVSEGFTDELKDLDYTNKEDFLFSESYKRLIKNYCYKKAEKRSASEEITKDIASIKELATIQNEFIKDSLLFENAGTYMGLSKDLQGYYDAFMAGSTNETHKEKITEQYKIFKKVAPGATSPKFVDYENFAGGTSSLDDFKGKYVYIDIWATWCGPCIYQMPYLDTIEKAYHGKNIEFVTLSVDVPKNRKKWLDFVKEKNLDGVQLLADNALNSEFIKAYHIKGIPRFLLIDPEGNIVTNNAPRPSDPKLKELFESLPL